MRAPGFWWERPGLEAALLSPLAAIYGSVAAARFARTGARAGVPVICIGNPTVGGAGKTPTAILVARLLVQAGERPVLLTRGYGGTLAGPVVVDVTAHRASEVGDEALLLARTAPTVLSRDRAAGAEKARAAGASVIVMDDGFQNPSLAKDFSILVVDGRRGIGNGRVIPAGPLRASLDRQLDRAHAVLLVGDVTGAAPVVIAARAKGLSLFHARLEPDAAALSALAEQRVLAFAGIGDPDKFFASLVAAGIEAPVRRSFGDHHRFSAEEAGALIAEAERGKLLLLTTEKDLARMQGDASLATLRAATSALPVTLTVAEMDQFRELVLGAARTRARPA